MLGALLLEGPAALAKVGVIAPAVFYRENHRVIFRAICRLHARGEAFDPILTGNELAQAGELDLAGGLAALALLVEQASIASHLRGYLGLLTEHAMNREYIALGARLMTANGASSAERETIVRAGEAFVRAVATAAPEPPTLRREGLDLALTWPSGVGVELAEIHTSRDGVRGVLTVTHRQRRLSFGSLPLSSITAREALRKKLQATAPGLPWADYLEDAAFRLTMAAREGEPIVTLTGTVTSPTRELLPRLLYEGEPTLVYADGDTGKSLFALAVAVAMQSGAALPFGLRPARPVPTMYLDWETTADTQQARLASLAAGLGIDPPPVAYRHMTRSMVDEAPALAAECARLGVGFVVVDSMMPALSSLEGGGFHEPITAFYNALRPFAPAAILVLSHVTNDAARNGGPARPYGGAFAWNGPRLMWEAKRDHDVDDATAIVFTCRKANNHPRKPDPFGLRFVPGDGTTTVYPLDLHEAAPSTTAGASLPYRVRLRLANQDMTTAELAEALAVGENVIRAVVSRMAQARPRHPATVVERGQDGKHKRWGLVSA